MKDLNYDTHNSSLVQSTVIYSLDNRQDGDHSAKCTCVRSDIKPIYKCIGKCQSVEGYQ